MKVAIFSESPADEAAIQVLVNALLPKELEPVALKGLRSRGWPAVEHILPVVLKQLHYHRDADALVVVVDSDDSPVHELSHDAQSAGPSGCRLCRLQRVIEVEQARLTPIAGRVPLKTAVGLAAPTLEAWLLAGTDVHITEAAWVRGLQARRRPYSRRDLKVRAYGAEPVSVAVETARMVELARELARNISLLEKHFSNGFGPLAQAIRGW